MHVVIGGLVGPKSTSKYDNLNSNRKLNVLANNQSLVRNAEMFPDGVHPKAVGAKLMAIEGHRYLK